MNETVEQLRKRMRDEIEKAEKMYAREGWVLIGTAAVIIGIIAWLWFG